MAIAAMPLDTAAVRPAPVPDTRSAVVRSQTEEPYNAEVDMSFGDFLDMINPLQHIPVVGTIYRAITGDTIKPASQVIGGIAFGGPIGGAAAIFSAIFAQANGSSIEDKMLGAVGIHHEDPATAVAMAEAAPPAATPQAAPLAAPSPAAAQAPTSNQAPNQTAATGATPAAARSAPGQMTAVPRQIETEHRPSRMPARDTVLANTTQAKHAAPMSARPGAQRVPGAPAPEAPAAPANANAPVQPEMLSDVMMRNLAKYEAAKKALNPTPPNLSVAG